MLWDLTCVQNGLLIAKTNNTNPLPLFAMWTSNLKERITSKQRASCASRTTCSNNRKFFMIQSATQISWYAHFSLQNTRFVKYFMESHTINNKVILAYVPVPYLSCTLKRIPTVKMKENLRNHTSWLLLAWCLKKIQAFFFQKLAEKGQLWQTSFHTVRKMSWYETCHS